MSLDFGRGVGVAISGVFVLAMASAFIGIGFHGHIFSQMNGESVIIGSALLALLGIGALFAGGHKAKKAWQREIAVQ